MQEWVSPMKSEETTCKYTTSAGHKVTVLIVCVCLSVTARAGAKRTIRAQLRYQKKVLNTRIKINIAI